MVSSGAGAGRREESRHTSAGGEEMWCWDTRYPDTAAAAGCSVDIQTAVTTNTTAASAAMLLVFVPLLTATKLS